MAPGTPKKSDQDRLDAAICLIVALQWRRGPRDRVVVIGDERHGYMVTPVSTETKAILQSAAVENGVPFDAPWPCDSERRPQKQGAAQVVVRREAPLPDRQTNRPCTNDKTDGQRWFDDAVLWSLLVETARAGELLTYGDVGKRLCGEPWSQRTGTALFDALDRVGIENLRRGDPLLPSLVGRQGEEDSRPWILQEILSKNPRGCEAVRMSQGMHRCRLGIRLAGLSQTDAR